MKIPLEPIPTDELVAVERAEMPAGVVRGHAVAGPLLKAYPWLLGTSVCISGLLCWLYVTKPVIVSASAQPLPDQPVEMVENDIADTVTAPVKVTPKTNLAQEPALIPSDDILPGEVPESSLVDNGTITKQATADIDPLIPSSSGSLGDDSIGWENTNLKVQHILRADAGTGELEKIILDVPVRYETRTMRWTPADIAQARTILSRLMVYERDLNTLRQQGQGILKDWNGLLERTVPASVLRADSPSLPYIHSYGGDTKGLPNSSSVIKVEESEDQ